MNSLLFDIYISKEDYHNHILYSHSSIIESYLAQDLNMATKAIIISSNLYDFDLMKFKSYSDSASYLLIIDSIVNDPLVSLNIIAIILHNLLIIEIPSTCLYYGRIFIRPFNHETITDIKNLKASNHGKLLAVKGSITKISNIVPKLYSLSYKCTSCLRSQVRIIFTSSSTTSDSMPKKCSDSKCLKKKFSAESSSPNTKYIDTQMIRIQQPIDDFSSDKSYHMPRFIDCCVYDNLVDKFVLGDNIILTGVLSIINENTNKDKRTLLMLYIDCYSINVLNKKNNIYSNTHDIKDYRMIKEISLRQDCFSLFIKSFCPSISGHNDVKAALVLSLFGGSFLTESSPIRSSIHVAIFGEPGMGKSQLLKFLVTISNNGIYVCGNSSTASGLTVTMTRDSGVYGSSFEVGALVLADKGHCCIDEFDKMQCIKNSSLLEIMEQQQINVAKGGLFCSLPSRTSIIVAANPSSSFFNYSKSVNDNLNMEENLLSRFDLIYLLSDNIDKANDDVISNHILNSSNSSNISINLSFNEESLCDVLSIDHMKKYIEYARCYVSPKLSPDSMQIIQNYYLKLRSGLDDTNTLVTVRTLESLKRLAQARAKVDLRIVVTSSDALEIIGLFERNSNNNKFKSPNNPKKLKGKKSQCKKLLETLHMNTKINPNKIYTTSDIKDIMNKNYIGENFEELIHILNEEGYLLKQSGNKYKLNYSL